MGSDPQDEKAALLPELQELAKHYAATDARPESLITADLGHTGWDYIEFIEHVERKFEVDLTGVSPKSARGEARECTIDELADMIIQQWHA